jgi:hypothetical protein
LDWLMLVLDGAEKLRSALLPIAYFDGYHLLSMIYEARNDVKATAPKYEDIRDLHKLLEIFLLGFEGLVVQLQWCLQAAGRQDLASSIPNVALTLSEAYVPRVPLIDSVMQVRGTVGQYEIFSLGHPGEECVHRFTYSNDGVDQVYCPSAVATEDPVSKQVPRLDAVEVFDVINVIP